MPILLLGIYWLRADPPADPTRQASPAKATAALTPSGATAIPAEYQGKLKLFILAGQSNMSGRGEVPGDLKHTNPRVYLFGNDYQWKLAEEPVDSAVGQVDMVSEDRDAGMSPSLSFAETLLGSKPEWAIGLIPCAKSSSSLLDWRQNDDPKSLYGSCLKRIQQAAANGQRGRHPVLPGRDGRQRPGLLYRRPEDPARRRMGGRIQPIRESLAQRPGQPRPASGVRPAGHP